MGVGWGGRRPSRKDLYLNLPEETFSLLVSLPTLSTHLEPNWALPSSLALGFLEVKQGPGTPVPNSQRYASCAWVHRRLGTTGGPPLSGSPLCSAGVLGTPAVRQTQHLSTTIWTQALCHWLDFFFLKRQCFSVWHCMQCSSGISL